MTYIINWFIRGDFINTGEYAFKSYAKAKEFAEDIYKCKFKTSLHYDIVKLKDVLEML